MLLILIADRYRNMSRLVLLKLDPMFACMDTCNMDVLRNAMKMACPIWQRRLQHMRGCAMVMISRNPMTHEICAVEYDSGRDMMMVRLLMLRERESLGLGSRVC